MEFQILGPLGVSDAGGRLEVVAPKQRAILAVLVVHANQVVSTDRLIDLVWGDDRPVSGPQALRFHVSKLRDALHPGRGPGEEGVIVTRAPGYVLVVDPGWIDAHRFEQLVGEAHGLLGSDPARSVELIDEAFRMWRGPPLGEFVYEDFARLEILRLEELRQRAAADRVDAALALGRHEDLIGELRVVTEKEPLRERAWGQLMVALYRSGRQAEALEAFQDLRRYLGEELGIEPSAELRGLEERILFQDPVLLEPGPVPAAGRLRGYVLLDKLGEGAYGTVWRAEQPGFGRQVAIKEIRSEFAGRREFIRRFEAEAQLVAALEHPNVVSLFDFWRDPDGAYLVMPYFRGGSLARAIRERRFDAAAAWSVISEVGGALDYAHRRGVVHRDVTPDNVLLDEEGHAYLADLGVAALVGDGGSLVTPSPAYRSPELIAGQPATRQSDVFSFGVLAAVLLDGVELDPVVSPGPVALSLPTSVAAVIERAVAPSPYERFADVESFLAALGRALGVAELSAGGAEVRNPFKGLRAFEETDTADFFGRELAVSELTAAVGHHRLVGVVGPSGCGKSSLVRAGLIPAVRAGTLPRSEGWLLTDFYPGASPFAELEAALLRVATVHPPDLGARLRAGDRDVIGELLPDGAELLLVVDQFEELFTLTRDDETRRRFLDLLAALAVDPNSRVRVVLTIRADFYDRPLEYSAFGELLGGRLVSVTAPSDDSLARAITGPAEAVGLTIEPGLEAEIVRDVSGQPGGLPLMEYALTELFHRRRDGRLTIEDYHSGGGVLGALGRRADELYASYGEPGRAAVRQVFLRLVAVDEGAADTRRRIPLTELGGLGLDPEALDAVLADYGSHRLLTFDRDPETRAPTVEVAHEALLTRWGRLAGWIDERRDDLVSHRHLAAWVTEWHNSGNQPGYLLSGGRLEHYESFAAATDLALTSDEQAFLAAGRKAADHERTRRRRRRRGILSGFAAAAVIAGVLAIVALVNQSRAEDARRVARSRELAASAIGVLNDDPELSLLLALAAAEEGDEPIFESVTALHEALLADRIVLGVPDAAGGGVLSPTGDVLVTFNTNVITGHDAVTGEELWIHELPVPFVARQDWFWFNPAGDRAVALVDAHPEQFDMEEDWIRSPDDPLLVFLDPDSGASDALETDVPYCVEQLVSNGSRTIHLDRPILAMATPLVDGECNWDVLILLSIDPARGTAAEVMQFDERTGGRYWTTDEAGEHLALVVRDRTTVIDIATRERTEWGPPADGGAATILNADGTLLYTAGGIPLSTVWDMERDTAVFKAPFTEGRYFGFISRDESKIMNENGVWDLSTGRPIVEFPGVARWDGASMNDAGTLAVTELDGRVLVLNLAANGEIGAVNLPRNGVYQLYLLTTGAGRGAILQTAPSVFGSVYVFDLATGVIEREFASSTGHALALSPDGRFVAFQEESPPGSWGRVVIGDLAAGAIVARMEGICPQNPPTRPSPDCKFYPETPFAGRVGRLAFLPDGSRLIGTIWDIPMPDGDRAVRTVVWDASSGELLHRFEHSIGLQSELSPAGDRLLLPQEEGGVVTLDTASWQEVERLEIEGWRLRFSADGRRLATDWAGTNIAVYDTATWTLISQIEADYFFWGLSISPDGSVLATMALDGFVRIHDTETLGLLQSIPFGEEVTNLEFISDTHLLVVPRTGPGMVVTTDIDELLQLARDRVTRYLTPEECATYHIDPCQTTE
jgi:DNA-binding SARP family transcriptional activator